MPAPNFMTVHLYTHSHTQAHTSHKRLHIHTQSRTCMQPPTRKLTHSHAHSISHTTTHTHSLTVPSSTQRGADAGEVWDWPPALSPAALKGPGNTSLLFPPSPLIFLTPGGSKPLLINHHRQILTEENNSGKTFTLLKMSLV